MELAFWAVCHKLNNCNKHKMDEIGINIELRTYGCSKTICSFLGFSPYLARILGYCIERFLLTLSLLLIYINLIFHSVVSRN